MSLELFFKISIVSLIGLILFSLAGGLFFLTRDKGQGKRTVYSLSMRITLSICLFIMLIIGYLTGNLRPHPILPPTAPPPASDTLN